MDDALCSAVWIDRFERHGGALCAIGLCASGIEHRLAPRELGVRGRDQPPLCVRATLDLARGQLASMDSYRHWLPPGASTAHQVLRFELGDWSLLLPALAIARATFRPFANLAPYLYSPLGLDAACIPADAACRSVHWTITIGEGLQVATDTHMSALGWAWGFPSGRAMWDSVYEHARSGRLGVELPRARVELVANVTATRKLLFAHSCALVTLEPLESPYPFCQSGREVRVLHRLPRTLFPRGSPTLDLR